MKKLRVFVLFSIVFLSANGFPRTTPVAAAQVGQIWTTERIMARAGHRRGLTIRVSRLEMRNPAMVTATMPRKESLLPRRGELLLRGKRTRGALTGSIGSQNGCDSLSTFRKNVRAVNE